MGTGTTLAMVAMLSLPRAPSAELTEEDGSGRFELLVAALPLPLAAAPVAAVSSEEEGSWASLV
jgi:hypothetical protein